MTTKLQKHLQIHAIYQRPKIYGGFKIKKKFLNGFLNIRTCSLNDENVIIVGDLTLNCIQQARRIRVKNNARYNFYKLSFYRSLVRIKLTDKRCYLV